MRGQTALRSPIVHRVPTIAAIAAMAFVLAPVCRAQTYTHKILHNFCPTACNDGNDPAAGLIMDQSGAVYGTASGGGLYDGGTVFKLTEGGGKITYARLHSFCKRTHCADGAYPTGVLVIDKDGNLYGTASASATGGLVFELSHVGTGWKYTELYSFCSKSNCDDGDEPFAGLAYKGQSSGTPWDETSPLFGTTLQGGTYNNGVAFELTKNGSSWTETVIHNFQSSQAPNSLLVDSSGNLFGTTSMGGQNGGGLMFKLANGTWKETVLHQFCNQTNCTDGNLPVGLLVMDASGNLYGVTLAGGTGSHQTCGYSNGCGVVFERTAGGTYSVLYNFCSLSNCLDGFHPDELLVENSGNLLGGANGGGSGEGDPGGGVFFELVNNSGRWSESVIYNFCSQTNCADGTHPDGGLLLDASGDIWGVTPQGGKNYQGGTLFEFVP